MRAVLATMAAGFAMAAATAAGGGTGAAVTCRVELDRGVLPAGQAQKAVLKISLEGVAPAVKRDRPTTASDDGRIELDTANLKLLERTGSVQWDTLLAPGETRRLTYTYERYVPSY